MYTLVLMAALTSAPDAPEFGGLFRNMFSGSSSCGGGCQGAACHGSCSGGCYGSCTGRSSNACYGSCSGCNGSCQGGGHFFGHRMRAFSNRNACYGSCSGQSHACYGSCCGGGCCGGMMPTMMYGQPDCFDCGTAFPLGVPGQAYGSDPMGTAPLTIPGGPLPTAPGMPPALDSNPAVPRPATPPPPAEIQDSRNGSPIGRSTAANGGRATVVVKLPTDAKLFAEGRELTLTSAERTFVTPVLPAGPGYTYTFRTEYSRDGETISQSKRVQVVAGGAVSVEFVDLTTARRPNPRGDAIAKDAEPKPTDLGLGLIAPVAPVSVEAPPPARPNPFLATPPATKPAAAPAVGDRARITVKLPPGATLYVDDKKNEKTDPVREFATPPLPAGQEFAYLMKSERLRDGRPEYQIQKVTFRAGEILTVDFTADPGR